MHIVPWGSVASQSRVAARRDWTGSAAARDALSPVVANGTESVLAEAVAIAGLTGCPAVLGDGVGGEAYSFVFKGIFLEAVRDGRAPAAGLAGGAGATAAPVDAALDLSGKGREFSAGAMMDAGAALAGDSLARWINE